MFRLPSFEIAAGSSTTWRSPYVNPLANILREQDELAGARSNAGSNKVFTSPKALILPFVPSLVEDLFTKFMKVFMKTMQA